MPQYRRLTQADRHRVEAMHRDGRSQKEIAQKVGFSTPTISRELRRNAGANGYFSLRAQKLSDNRRLICRRKKVIDRADARLFYLNLRKGLSPELFSGRLRLKRHRAPSTSTLYRYARALGWSRRLLPRSGRRGAGRYIQQQKPAGRLFIASRPASVELRTEFGHWERDTLYAAKGRLLLVLLERKSRFLLIAPLRKRTAIEVTNVTQKLLRKSSLPTTTITNDNGKEFSDAESLEYPVYFCEPRKPQQRGAVENVNRMLRRYITRQTDLDSLRTSDFKRIQNAINNRPRKCLGFWTAAEIVRAQKLH